MSFRTMLKSKIHRARVTECNVDYEGSVTIDAGLMKAADILPYERVEILDVNNSARFTTYAIEGEEGSGEICLNGAAARMVSIGDIVIILTYQDVAHDDASHVKPRMVYVDGKNRITSTKNIDAWMDDLINAR
ncbi:MAG: aspartate 1-decarboxylase [Dehalococcoidia bacterium]|nr:aspartate 1-decarboxylase [Dehalococcoidia bacterium]